MGVMVELQGLSPFPFPGPKACTGDVHEQLLQKGLEETESCCWAKVRGSLHCIAAEARTLYQHLAAQRQQSLPKRQVFSDVTPGSLHKVSASGE